MFQYPCHPKRFTGIIPWSQTRFTLKAAECVVCGPIALACIVKIRKIHRTEFDKIEIKKRCSQLVILLWMRISRNAPIKKKDRKNKTELRIDPVI